MKNSIFLLLFLLLVFINNINSQVTQEWISAYNGSANGNDNAFAITVDNTGNVYVTGYSYGAGTFEDCTTIKYSPSGQQQWERRYNGPGNGYDAGLGILIDGSGDIYVAGHSRGNGTESDCLLIKYSPSGEQLWVQRFDAANKNDNAYAVAADASGNIFLIGASIESGINQDYVTIKYNPSGEMQWFRRYNGTGNSYDVGRRIAVDGSGNICVTGYSVGSGNSDDYVTIKYNPSGVEQWVKRYNNEDGNGSDRPSSIVVDNSGNVIVSGTSYGNTTGIDGVTIKYNHAGEEQWLRRYNGPQSLDDYSNEIALDGFGNIYLTGSSFSNYRYDYVTIKYNPTGLEEWVRIYNGPSNSDDTSYDIAVDASGNVYVTGKSMETIGNWSGVRFATVKYSPSGFREWVERFTPSEGTASANDIVVDGSGNVYVTGLSTGIASDDYTTIKYSHKLTGIQPVTGEIPDHYSLSQNYPNPFNPETKIKFSIPAVGGRHAFDSRLIIYDALGREIETLVNEQLNPGIYEVNWNASNHPSGVYFYKLISGDFTQTKKLILIK